MSKDTAIRCVDIIYALEHSKLLKKHGIFSVGAKAKFFSREPDLFVHR
jgi:ribosome-associated protein YbcJ (S4-like RNA binding protein)